MSRLDHRFEALEIRRGNTLFQLTTILEENHQSLIFVEHVPLLYEDAAEMTEYVSLAPRETAKEASSRYRSYRYWSPSLQLLNLSRGDVPHISACENVPAPPRHC